MDDYRLCPLHAGDVAELHAIDRECFDRGIAYSIREITNLMRSTSGPHLGAVLGDGRLAGFILANLEDGRGHIVTLDVRLEHRRLGIGSALMDAAEEQLRRQGASVVRLEVSERNTGAQTFYQARGYRLVRRLRAYYRAGEDALRLEKALREAG